MPWEKRFDHDEVLDRAMELFWAHGYRGVSMADLVAELGVNRSSLYATYGQKDALFVSALARYDRIHRQEWLAAIESSDDPIEAIRRTFSDVAAASRGDRPLGCLLVNTILELPADEPLVGDLVQDAFAETEGFFARQIDRARVSGALPDATDSATLASALMALLLGIRVLSRAQRPTDAIDPILTQVDALLHSA